MSERIEPEWAMATVVFVDIRGFTGFADRSTARDVVAYLNDFFGLVVPIVTRHGGRPHQLLGDGVLAVFGAPDPGTRPRGPGVGGRPRPAGLVDSQLGERCRIGIGINSGLVLVGTLGGGEHYELSIVGDPVNVAARVQDTTRELGEPLLLSEATRCLLGSSQDRHRARGTLSLRGKSEPVAIYGLAPVTVSGPLSSRDESG